MAVAGSQQEDECDRVGHVILDPGPMEPAREPCSLGLVDTDRDGLCGSDVLELFLRFGRHYVTGFGEVAETALWGHRSHLQEDPGVVVEESRHQTTRFWQWLIIGVLTPSTGDGKLGVVEDLFCASRFRILGVLGIWRFLWLWRRADPEWPERSKLPGAASAPGPDRDAKRNDQDPGQDRQTDSFHVAREVEFDGPGRDGLLIFLVDGIRGRWRRGAWFGFVGVFRWIDFHIHC